MTMGMMHFLAGSGEQSNTPAQPRSATGFIPHMAHITGSNSEIIGIPRLSLRDIPIE